MRTQAQARPAGDFPAYPVLPGTLQRSQVEGLLVDVRAALGLSPSRLTALLTMVRATRPSDWTDPACDAVCYARQTQIADQLGKTTRQVRSDESALVRLGLIYKSTANDGSRCAIQGPDGELRLGISFAPLIERIPHLLELRELVQRENRRGATLRRQCSALRRELRQALEAIFRVEPQHPGAVELAALYASWPRRFDAFGSNDELELHRQAVENAAHKALQILEMCDDSSGVSAVQFRPLQDTTKKKPESCNGPAVDKRPARKRADTKSFGATPNGSAHCLEYKCEAASGGDKPQFLDELNPVRLLSLCSDEMKFYVEAFQGDRSFPTTLDFIQAACIRVPELGVNDTAWTQAVEAMGDMGATLAVLVIDANRDHPVTPIHSPGGALRAFTRRHRTGQLNLAGSLIGLAERRRNDRHRPRT